MVAYGAGRVRNGDEVCIACRTAVDQEEMYANRHGEQADANGPEESQRHRIGTRRPAGRRAADRPPWGGNRPLKLAAFSADRVQQARAARLGVQQWCQFPPVHARTAPRVGDNRGGTAAGAFLHPVAPCRPTDLHEDIPLNPVAADVDVASGARRAAAVPPVPLNYSGQPYSPGTRAGPLGEGPFDRPYEEDLE